jgi:hypothetical protein
MKHRNQHFMKKIQAVIASCIALALFSATTLFAAEAPSQTKAIVRAVHGQADYNAGGGWLPLRPNMELDPGTQIKTGPDSYVSLNVNGLRSSIRISQNTTMTLDRMNTMGSGGESDSDTSLKLDAGTVLGQVKKLSANSRYEIVTPEGVAGIRGTDFEVSVIVRPDGKYRITFHSITGTVVCVGVVDNVNITKVLTDHQSWTIGEDVVPTPKELIDYEQTIIEQLQQYTTGALTLPPPPFVQAFQGNGTSQTGNGSTQSGNAAGTSD